MKPLSTCLIYLLAAGIGHALDAETIEELAQKPHSRENLVDELKIFANAREYKVNVKGGEVGSDAEAWPEITAAEKTVEGRYIVSETIFPGDAGKMIMVVYFDDEKNVFRKWVLFQEILVSFTGLADPKNRTIAWTSSQAFGEPGMSNLSIETHSDEGVSWKEATMKEGVAVMFLEGVATKVR